MTCNSGNDKIVDTTSVLTSASAQTSCINVRGFGSGAACGTVRGGGDDIAATSLTCGGTSSMWR